MTTTSIIRHILSGISYVLFDVQLNVESWKDFKNMLKHKKENVSLIEFGSHLHIEEGIHAQEKGKEQELSSSFNMMKGVSQNGNKEKGKKRPFDSINSGPNDDQSQQGNGAVRVCQRCEKSGHLIRDCRVGKGKKDEIPKPAQESNDSEQKSRMMIWVHQLECVETRCVEFRLSPSHGNRVTGSALDHYLVVWSFFKIIFNSL